MEKRFLLFYTVFSFFALVALAQERTASTVNEEEDFNKGQRVKYWDNWFVSTGTGVSLLWGEQDQEIAGIFDRLKIGGISMTVGKWFTPAFGMRIQGIYAPLKGYNYVLPMGQSAYFKHQGAPNQKSAVPSGFRDGQYIGTLDYWSNRANYEPVIYDENNWRSLGGTVTANNGTRAFIQAFNYWSVTVDLMANLSTLFRGYYKAGTAWDIIPFAGVGLIHTKRSNSTADFTYGVLKLGIRPSFNLNSNLAIFAELQGNITGRDFDGYVGDQLFDLVFHAHVGLQYTFNKRFETQIGSGGGGTLTLDEINYLNEKINKNRERLDKHEGILNRQQDLLDRLNQGYEDGPTRIEREVITQTEVVSAKYLPEYIRFTLNSTQIQFSEERKFKEAVEFLKANPSSKLLLVGYADKNTGTSTYNYDLSRRRVEAVSEELIRRGIDPNRLVLEWKGDQEQPYAPNDWNRVVIMVER